ncbi:MAG: acyl-CoA dehydrogenase, partial [Sphingomonadales bacterium]|nr:acyl-CoA dehydrogenase [Sphingomonadales bacterium]
MIPICEGKKVVCFCFTEPDTGSNPKMIKTTAVEDGDSYVLNGTKRFITNAPKAHVFTLMARTGTPEEGARGVTAFLVDANLDGIELGPKDKKMGQRGTSTCDVILNNVRVHKDQIIGGVEGLGFKTAMKVLDRGRLHISAIACGAARRLIDESVTFAIERKQFGQRVADFQLIQAMLADSEAEWLAAKSMVEAVAKKKDEGAISPKEAASCKLFSTEMVGRVADRAVQIHGGAGYMNEYVVEHFYRDVRLFRLYEGTSQIQQIVIARDLIKQAESGNL